MTHSEKIKNLPVEFKTILEQADLKAFEVLLVSGSGGQFDDVQVVEIAGNHIRDVYLPELEEVLSICTPALLDILSTQEDLPNIYKVDDQVVTITPEDLN